MKILILTRFDEQGASSRVRSFQFLPWLESNNISYSVSPLFSKNMLLCKYEKGSYGIIDIIKAYLVRVYVLIGVNRYDLVWIEKEAFPWMPVWFEKAMLKKVPYVLDFDDAIFHNYDLHRNKYVRFFLGQRIDLLMKGSSLVTVGNKYLRDRALSASAKAVEIIPSVVDIERYSPKMNCCENTKPIIVWIGSPSSTQYLYEFYEVFIKLSQKIDFTLRVIGGAGVMIPGVDVDNQEWSLEKEVLGISGGDLGIMPLKDSPWERGKCSYKLIQYMACGLPVVASPVGMNCEVVIENITGFLASTNTDWLEKMYILLSDEVLRKKFGQAGRVSVESNYSLQIMAPKLLNLIKTLR